MAEWSLARRHSFIVSTLRSGTRRWPPKYETLNEAKTEKRINKKTGRMAQHYLCTSCQEDFPAKQISVDHKRPAVDPKKGWVSWDDFIEKLFCDKDNLQTLCRECHAKKTAEERKQRKKK